MDLGKLLFSPEGRIGQRDFWLGFLILFVGGILIHAVVLIGTVVWALSTYCWVCLFSKRLHDMGRSGFAQVWIYIFDFLAVAALFIGGLGGILAGVLTGHGGAAWGLVAGGIGLFMLGFLAWFLVRIGFILWLGMTPGQASDNRYGPVPAR